MTIYFCIMFFIIGTIFGSFYNVVGYRLPKGESLLSPGSHCPNCNHRLSPLELIPIFSWLLQHGKCKNCKGKIALFYPIFEASCGFLFMLCYLVFGLSLELIIALTFTSMIIIVVLTDYYYMIIPDEVLIFFIIALIVEIYLIFGLKTLGLSLLHAILAFGVMFLLKIFGDKMFKREAMGGGDVKLMFVFGLVLGAPMTVVSIFLASILGLPISLILMHKKRGEEIPFGPYLSLGALIVFFLQLDLDTLISLLTFY